MLKTLLSQHIRLESKQKYMGRYMFMRKIIMSMILSPALFSRIFIGGVFADTITNPLGNQFDSIGAIIDKFIQVLFPIIGFVLFVMVVYGGITWLTSGGSPEKVKHAQGIITAAVIGFVIIALSAFIVNFINGVLGVASPVSIG